jgi:hypothetical protein
VAPGGVIAGVARLDRPDSWAAPTRGVGPCSNRQAYSLVGAH